MISAARKCLTSSVALLFLLALPGWASRLHPTVDVHFSHPVDIGTTTVPAGNYQFIQVQGRANQPEFDVRTMQGKSEGLTYIGSRIVDTSTPPAVPNKTDVVLKKVDGQSYLWEVWIQGRHRGWQFPLPQDVRQKGNGAPVEHVSGTQH